MAGMPKRNIGKTSRSPDEDRNLSMDVKSKPNVKVEDVNEENKACIVPQPYQVGQQSHIPQQPIPPLPQQPHMPPPYPTYSYGAHDQFNVDPNQRPYPMMAPAPYNMYAAMNTWPGNQMDGMAMNFNNMPANQGLPVSMPQDMQPNASGGMPYAPYMPMHGDMYGMMNGMGNYCPYPMFPPEPVAPPVKETIVLTTCSLYPPHPGQTIRTRERHPGCKTVFCGGLPEKITEEIVREVFEKCGAISTVRMSKKNFCHVRFAAECYVDEAMKLSGYRMKIENKDESAYCGRLHVDFAKARDDEYEYECLQRALQREARHRERLEQEATRPPTPPPVVHYSDHEAVQLFDKLKSDDHAIVMDAMHILLTWLERGECTKKNSVHFFQLLMSMGQSSRRLLNEKKNLTKKLNDAKSQMHQKMTFISLCFNDIYKVFEVIQKSPSILENFSKSQRKEIETLSEKTLEVTRSHSKEMVDERVEDEMELSDDEETAEQPVAKPVENRKRITKEDLNKLKQENERLRAQYDIELANNKKVKKDRDANHEAFERVVNEMKNRADSLEQEISELTVFKENHIAQLEADKTKNQARVIEAGNQQGNTLDVPQHETLLMTLVSTFLIVHPFGAGIDYICSYLLKVDPKINNTDVENLLRKFPNLFKEQSSGIGATLMKTWKFLGFNTDE